jgi:hypothetical protein
MCDMGKLSSFMAEFKLSQEKISNKASGQE